MYTVANTRSRRGRGKGRGEQLDRRTAASIEAELADGELGIIKSIIVRVHNGYIHTNTVCDVTCGGHERETATVTHFSVARASSVHNSSEY